MDVIKVCDAPLTVLVVVGERHFYLVGERAVYDLALMLDGCLPPLQASPAKRWWEKIAA